MEQLPPGHWANTWMLCRGKLTGICRRVAQTLANAHKTSFSMWYAYIVSLSVVLQDNWTQMEQYVPVKLRHGVVIFFTLVAMGDKLRRAARATRPPPP